MLLFLRYVSGDFHGNSAAFTSIPCRKTKQVKWDILGVKELVRFFHNIGKYGFQPGRNKVGGFIEIGVLFQPIVQGIEQCR